MSIAELKARGPFSSRVAAMNFTRLRSAPAAISRGTSVSSMSSSPDQISTSPWGAGVPSGHTPPREITAAYSIASVVFPVPGAPARMCNLPRASQYDQSQSIALGA